MQKRLFVDRFDGTLSPKTFGQWQLYHIWKCVVKYARLTYDELYCEEKFIIDSKNVVKYINSEDLSWEKDPVIQKLFVEQFIHSIQSPVKVSHVSAITTYVQDSSQNYIFSDPLTKTLQHTKANISINVLPEEPFCYYMEMPNLYDLDGTTIEGIILTKKNYPKDKYRLEILYYTSVNGANLKKYSDYWSQNDDCKEFFNMHDLDYSLSTYREKTLEVIRKVKPIEIKSIAIPYSAEEGEKKLDQLLLETMEKSNKGAPYKDWNTYDFKDLNKDIIKKGPFKTIINGLLYILSGEEHLTAESNVFPKKKSKNEAMRKIYTSKPFFTLGKNVKFLREYVEDGYYWAPFFRKKANSDSNKKTVFVKGHFKYFKNKEQHN